MYVVILAGGSGTRFWPLSRKKTPKQLMSVFGGKSMLQRTVERVLPLNPKRILVVTNTLQAEETCVQLKYIQQVPIEIIEEPVGRNTAPAIGLAAAIIARYEPDAVMAVLPADHYITNEAEFRATLLRGQQAALGGSLITLGIVATRPETGYGYIEADTALKGTGPFPVKRFVEKPNRERALEFLLSGNFYWNSGMFIWKACAIRHEISRLMPELSSSLDKLTYSQDPWVLAELQPQINSIYQEITGESIDFGVMEKADNVQVIPSDFGWSDVGSWSAIPEVVAADASSHVVINTKELLSVESSDCLVYGDGRVLALVDVHGLIVVNTADALLVCNKDRAQDVKKVVEELERRGMSEYL